METKVVKEPYVWSEERLQQLQGALDFAHKAHRLKFRKKLPVPYLQHPLQVLRTLADWEVEDIDVWRAAICHDVLEDCPEVSFDDLVVAIGSMAAGYVEELTFIPKEDPVFPAHVQKKEYMRTWLLRVNGHAGPYQKSVQSLIIKVADRIVNVNDYLVSNPEYAQKYFAKGEALFEAMMSRQEEIITTFGFAVFPRMRFSEGQLSQMVA